LKPDGLREEGILIGANCSFQFKVRPPHSTICHFHFWRDANLLLLLLSLNQQKQNPFPMEQ
jgi:hypothetical protein